MDARPGGGEGTVAARRFRRVLLALAVVVGFSRLLLVPGVPWEQDEALFAATAFDTNIVEHRPHPPGFPLWVGVAKLSRAAAGDPMIGLQLASAVLSVLGVVLLALAWRPAVGDDAALLGAALFAFLPGVWFHAVRAFTTTPALTLLLAAAAVLWRPGAWAAAGAGLFVGLALGVRPVLLPPAAVLLGLGLWLRRDGPRAWLAAAASAAVAVVAPLAVLVATTGGLRVFLAACREHLGGHTGALHTAPWALPGLGIVRAAGGTAAAALLVAAAAAGAVAVLRGWRARLAWWLCTGVTAAWLLLAHNRTYPRYTVPLFALLTVPAVAAVVRLAGRRAGTAAAALAVAAAAAAAWPAVRDQAVEPFPPLEALAAVGGGPTTAVVGPGLSPFGDLANLARWGPGRTVMRDLVRSGVVAESSLPPGLAAVWAAPAPCRWIRPPLGAAREFRCRSGAVARLAQGRYLTAWSGSGGAVLLEPAKAACTEAGTPPLLRAELLLPAVAPGGRVGLVVDAGRAGVLTARGGGRVLGRWPYGAGTAHGVFRPWHVPGIRKHPWRLGLEFDSPVRIRRVWIEDPAAGAGDLEIPPGALVDGLDGLVWSQGLYGEEAFSGGRGRWTGREAVLFLPLAEGQVRLRLLAPRPEPARVTLEVPPGTERPVTIGASWQEVALPVAAGHRRVVVVRVDNPFVPAAKDPRSTDTRELGVVVGTVRVVTSRRP